jgi:hypothetical protein
MSARTRRRRALYAAAGITEPPQEALNAPMSPETDPPAPNPHPDASPPPTEPLSGSPELVSGRSVPKRPLSDSELDALAALAADLPPGTRPDRRRAVILERLRQASDTP